MGVGLSGKQSVPCCHYFIESWNAQGSEGNEPAAGTVLYESHQGMVFNSKTCWEDHAALAGRQRSPTFRSSCSSSV